MATGWIRPRARVERALSGVVAPADSAPAQSRARRHLVWQTTLSGAFGGGVLGAGFGPLATASGMLFGGLAGYLFERAQIHKTETASR
jgi:hypothetical protein